jgi:hypothetical protein
MQTIMSKSPGFKGETLFPDLGAGFSEGAIEWDWQSKNR